MNDHVYTLNYLNVPAVFTNFLITKLTSSQDFLFLRPAVRTLALQLKQLPSPILLSTERATALYLKTVKNIITL